MRSSAVLRGTLALAVAATCGACAVAKSGSAPSAEPGASPAAYGQPGSPSGSPPAPGQYAPAPPPPPPSAEAAPVTPTTPGSPSSSTPAAPNGGAGSSATSRSVAILGASREVESSQRELDVAGGDCRNACRALGSMDRAAGRLCELSQGNGEPQRCDDAKRRVYSARDRVKNNCGTCADGTTVDRGAPIPSR
jgi:type IV secretory pathway VirB10-like protein